ncbi:unannotated protein [freshwater metagenome]|uniref:Unannotated protein n=1 Tax=freshwater metagenome TaxID=449393 RepID=A0A6J5Z5G6_9ZZZZ|nr:hypothetical protein [Actinomycetota bacterium]
MDLKFSLVKDERGSISLLVMAFFLISVTTSLIITDVAAIAVAKRSLTQATEAAAQRGVRNLDREAYYSGEFDLSTLAANVLGIGPNDPGVPIDCSRALGDSQGALADWASGPSSLRRVELNEIAISDIQCDGFGIQLITSATARLPITIPFFKIEEILVTAQVSTTNTRKAGFSPFGIRVF